MRRGFAFGLHLREGLSDEDAVARALANLAADRLQRERGERLAWQVLRVEGLREHHYRPVVRHPERALDSGIKAHLARLLRELSGESVESLAARFAAAERQGLRAAPLRRVQEEDLWEHDDYWQYIGGGFPRR